MTAPLDPNDPAHHGKPLWCVHAYDSAHVVLPVGRVSRNGYICVWGYSVYRRVPGFRTIGSRFDGWAKNWEMCLLFATQAEALDEIASRTRVAKGAT